MCIIRQSQATACAFKLVGASAHDNDWNSPEFAAGVVIKVHIMLFMMHNLQQRDYEQHNCPACIPFV